MKQITKEEKKELAKKFPDETFTKTHNYYYCYEKPKIIRELNRLRNRSEKGKLHGTL